MLCGNADEIFNVVKAKETYEYFITKVYKDTDNAELVVMPGLRHHMVPYNRKRASEWVKKVIE